MAVQTRLTSRQRRLLLGQGYLVVRSQLDPAVLARIKDRLAEVALTVHIDPGHHHSGQVAAVGTPAAAGDSQQDSIPREVA